MAQYAFGVYRTPGSTPPPPALRVTTAALPAGRANVAYTTTLAATGGTAPYSWTFLFPNNALPAGLSLNPSTGVLSGTPTVSGTYTLVAQATDGVSATAVSGSLSLVIDVATTGALRVATTVVPDGKRGFAYSSTLAATGGTPPYTWSLVAPNNVLPTGLALTAGTGVIAGTPTVFETKTLVVRVTDAAGTSDSGSLPLAIDQVDNPAISNSAALPTMEVGVAYSKQLSIAGGWAPFTWTKTVGSYPAGITLNATGLLSGTPTTVGAVSFSLTATDSEARVSPAVAFTGTVVAAGTVAGPHDYFNAVKARVELIVAESLRDQARLNDLLVNRVTNTPEMVTAGAPTYYNNETTKVSHLWEYKFPGADVFDNGTSYVGQGKDAARFYFDPSLTGPYRGQANLLLRKPWHFGGPSPRQNCLQVPLNISSGRILLAVDTWNHRGWRDNRTDFARQWKQFRFRTPGGSDGTTYWSAAQVGGYPQTAYEYGGAPPASASFGKLMNLAYKTADYDPLGLPAGNTAKDPYAPTGLGARLTTEFNYPWDTWIRHIFEIRMFEPPTAFTDYNTLTGKVVQYNAAEPDGTWHMLSYWVLTETSGPFRILYKVPWFTENRATIKDFHFNDHTSQGEMTANAPLLKYARNLVALQNYVLPTVPEDDALIFVRPIP